KELASQHNIQVGTTRQDTINAIEDLICDELALETAFEGNRFADLCRMARHKNEAGLYGGNFGSLWLARKLAFKNPQKDLTNPENWYLPFK
ncbi:MAG: RagB/SusD family nutrient uptake outer membrane protein, partial [Prevotella sp.]|nr:RagB/SusD family nutrient uptake outer membrane protein [Prevotella sp.]